MNNPRMNQTIMNRGARRGAMMFAMLLALTAGCARVGVGGSQVESAVAKVKPALVRIHVVSETYGDGRAWKQQASGSGAIISPDGYIVTNHHVVGDAVRIFVTMPDLEEIEAELIGTDAMADIAVIRLKPHTPRKFRYVTWADSDALMVGDPVLAMGSPRALAQSVTEGVVSAIDMTMPRQAGNFTLDGENVGAIVRWIMHDAAIYPGNSGGPLVNLKGEIVGINEIGFGLGGAIPGNLARQVADTLIAHGEVKRGFLGFMMQPMFKSAGDMQGVIVSDVIRDTPAAKAGMESGDRIVSITADGKALPTAIRYDEEIPPLNLAIANLPIGKPVHVVADRNGEKKEWMVAPAEREPVLPKNHELKNWGMTCRDLSIWTAIELKRESTQGALVTTMSAGGPAAQAKPALRPRDVILEVDGGKVDNAEQLMALTAKALEGVDEGETRPVLVKFMRGEDEMLSVVEVGIRELADPAREVRKPWLPIGMQVLTRDLREHLELEGRSGVRVTQVYGEPGGEQALGLKPGDLILELDGTPLPVSEEHDLENFMAIVRQYRVNTEVELTVMREGQEMKLKGKLQGRPAQPREMRKYQDHDFEFTVRDMAYLDKVNNELEPEALGVLVESVQDGGWAALAGLRSGDIIQAINGDSLDRVEHVRSIMEGVKERQQRYTIFKVKSGTQFRFVEIEAYWGE